MDRAISVDDAFTLTPLVEADANPRFAPVDANRAALARVLRAPVGFDNGAFSVRFVS